MSQPELFSWTPPPPKEILGDRAGETFEPKRDRARLNAQAQRVWACMADGKWRSLREIAAITGDPEASISARLRDFRKPEFGAFQVDQVFVKRGLHRYKLVLPT